MMMSILSRTTPAREEPASAVQPYVYRPGHVPGNGDETGQSQADGSSFESLWTSVSEEKVGQAITEEEVQAREKAAWERGVQEGNAQAGAEHVKALTGERDVLAATIRDFVRERETYYHRVETEVVRLALAIARRILHREAQIDPLLLTGIVRVVLEKVAAGTNLTLRVHPTQVVVWRSYFADQPQLPAVPELVGDPSLEHSQCVLETALGATDFSWA